MTLSSALTAFAAALIPLGAGSPRPRRDNADVEARRRARRDYERLLRLPDHLLSDIGVSRAEVEGQLHASNQR